MENENVDGQGSKKEARKREIKDTHLPEERCVRGTQVRNGSRYVSQYVECVEWSNANAFARDFAKQTSAPLSFRARFRFLLSLSWQYAFFDRPSPFHHRNINESINTNLYETYFKVFISKLRKIKVLEQFILIFESSISIVPLPPPLISNLYKSIYKIRNIYSRF